MKISYVSSICLTDFYQKGKEDFGIVESESIARVENGASFCVDLFTGKEESCGYCSVMDDRLLRPNKEIMGIGST